MTEFLISGELKQQLAENVHRLERVTVSDANLRKAAVALVVTCAPFRTFRISRIPMQTLKFWKKKNIMRFRISQI